MSIIFTKYLSLLQSRPLLTKSVTSGALAGIGDAICQGIEYSKLLIVPFGFRLSC